MITDKCEIYLEILKLKKFISEQALIPQANFEFLLGRVLGDLDEIIPHELDECYKIISGHTNAVMGKCMGKGIPDVLFEEPEARFEKITKEEFDKYEVV